MKKYKSFIAFATTIAILLTAIVGLFVSLQGMKDKYRTAESNYQAQITQTVHWKDEHGREVATTYEIKLTAREVKHSKDSVIQKLLSNNEKLGNKLRRTESMMEISLTASGGGTARVDTITRYVDSSIYLSEVDSFKDKTLEIIRVKDIGTNLATYQYQLNPIVIDVSVTYEKEGKWRLIRFIFPRTRRYKVDLTSTNEDIEFEYVKYIKIK